MADKDINHVTIFGEVLFDCFQQDDKEEYVLGGAPFNVCWHLQALGDDPVFISRVGNDELGKQIIEQAQAWGVITDNIQQDPQHPTGQVQVTVIDNEPHYNIKSDSAYDFINLAETRLVAKNGILYHGSLALRSDYAKTQFKQFIGSGNWDLFVDVNLRSPWWDKESLFAWIEQARWVKLNVDELRELGFNHPNLQEAIRSIQQRFGNEQVIITQGEEGATVFTKNTFYRIKPEPVTNFVDTVGAGDAFTAVYIHGLLNQWPIEQTLMRAQGFATKIIGIRGATPQDKRFYRLSAHA